MVRVFYKNGLAPLIIILIYAIAGQAYFLLQPSAFPIEFNSPLYRMIHWGIEQNQNFAIFWVLQLSLSLTLAFFVNRFVNKHRIAGQKNHLGGLVFILLSCIFYQWLFLSPMLFVLFPLLGMIDALFRSYSKKSFLPLFDAGFYLGIASLIFPPIALGFGIIIMFYLMTRLFSPKEWLCTFFAFLCPVFLTWTAFFLTDNDQLFYAIPLDFAFNIDWIRSLSIKGFIKMIYLLLLFALALFIFRNRFLKTGVQFRKCLSAIFWFGLLSLLLVFFPMSNLPFSMGWIILPLSINLGYLLYLNKPGFLSEFIHVTLLLLLFLTQYLNL